MLPIQSILKTEEDNLLNKEKKKIRKRNGQIREKVLIFEFLCRYFSREIFPDGQFKSKDSKKKAKK